MSEAAESEIRRLNDTHLVMSITFETIPSINEYLREMKRDRQKGAQFEKKWRAIGHRTIEPDLNRIHKSPIRACRRADGTVGICRAEPMLTEGALLWFHIWKKDRRIMDSSLNLYTKPIEDGLTDAGLWPGDDDRYVIGKFVTLAGIDKLNPHVELSLYVRTGDYRDDD